MKIIKKIYIYLKNFIVLELVKTSFLPNSIVKDFQFYFYSIFILILCLQKLLLTRVQYILNQYLALMRLSRSIDKQFSRTNRLNYKSPQISYFQSQKDYQTFSKTDSQNIQNFYIKTMFKMYNQNQKTFPEPYKILNSIIENEKKIIELQKALLNSREAIRLMQAKKTLKSEPRTSQSLYGFDQSKSYKLLQEEYRKLKLKLLPILQSPLANTQSLINLTTAQNQKVPQILSQCISHIMNNFKTQIQSAEEIFLQKQRKKYQILQQKYKRQIQEQVQLNKKLINKISDFTNEQNKIYQQLKRIQQQKNQLHTQIAQKHQIIVEKSNIIKQLKQKMKLETKRMEGIENKLEDFGRDLLKKQDIIRDNQQINSELLRKIKQLQATNQRLQNQINLYRKKLQQKVLQKPLTKVRSFQSLTSISLLEQNQNKNPEITLLNNRIIHLQKQLQTKDRILQIAKYQLKSTRQLSQKIIIQWKIKLQKTIQDHDREIIAQNVLINALQNEITQLKSQLSTREKVNKEQEYLLQYFKQKEMQKLHQIQKEKNT